MKFKIIRSNFLEGLKKVQNIAPTKGTIPIIQNARLEARDGKLFITTTDMDVSIKTAVECVIEEEGSTTLPVKLLSSTISKVADGEVTIDVDDNDRAHIKAGSATFRIAGMSDNEFPPLPEDSNSYAYVVPQLTLREMLRKTAYAASQDETRKTLRGVLMSFKDGKITMVATDGRRLALVEHEIEFPATAEQDVILPSKLVAELQRAFTGDSDVSIKLERSQISFEFEGMRIYSKLIDQIYPNYRQVIPQNLTEHVSVDRQLLLNALDRASVMMIDESNSTRLVFDNNELLVMANKTDVGEARDIVPIKYEGSRIEIVFNPSYVMDPLKAIDDDEVTIELNDGTTPAIMRCSVPFLYVMMPLRLN